MVRGKPGKAAGPAGLRVVGSAGPRGAMTWAMHRGGMGGQAGSARVKLGFGPID
jgi:hypothetical protein